MQDIITLQAIRTNCVTGKETLVEVQIIREYIFGKYIKDWWIKIIKGGVTGYESMQEEHVENMTKGWHACAGTKGRWDTLFIPAKEIQQLAIWVKEKQSQK